jgi:hypothetical protein
MGRCNLSSAQKKRPGRVHTDRLLVQREARAGTPLSLTTSPSFRTPVQNSVLEGRH